MIRFFEHFHYFARKEIDAHPPLAQKQVRAKGGTRPLPQAKSSS
jgi:hypothetical protein